MTAPLLHVGYHKTGTSWLQKRLFPREDLGYRRLSLSKKESDFIRVNDLDFDPERYRRELAPLLAAAARDGRVPVVSHERLSGNPHSGGYDSKRLAERLQHVFPDARVLIVIREQRDMILSCYAQYVKVGGGCSLRDYVLPCGGSRQPMFSLDHFRYHRLIGHYQKLFGAEHVLVLPFERLRADPRGFVAAIAGFSGGRSADDLPFGSAENRSLGPIALAVKRRLNPFCVRDSVNGNSALALPALRPVARGLARVVDWAVPRSWNRLLARRWRSFVEELVAGTYEDSNRSTAELTGLDLAAWGYAVGAGA
jgi:hypothetical protein